MNRLVELVLTFLIGAGLPLSQFAIRLGGRRGAAAVVVVTAGILAADLAALAPGRSAAPVRRVVRVEAFAAAVATITGALLLRDGEVREAQDDGFGMGRPEMFRRMALGLMFGILSARFRSLSIAAPRPVEARPPS